MNKPKLIISSAYAATVAIIFVVVITVWAELSPPLKNWLANFSGHHWTSKSIFSVGMYAVATVVLYFILHEPNDTSIRKALFLLLVLVVLGVIIITLFYTGHHFGFF